MRIWDGPHHDWFIGGTQCLIGQPWRVTNGVEWSFDQGSIEVLRDNAG